MDETLRVLIKKGPVSVDTSLKELEENYASKPEWKVIEGGGVISVPVEEFRMINLPKPGRSGKVQFEEKKGKGVRLPDITPRLNTIYCNDYCLSSEPMED